MPFKTIEKSISARKLKKNFKPKKSSHGRLLAAGGALPFRSDRGGGGGKVVKGPRLGIWQNNPPYTIYFDEDDPWNI
jgi:hypothetical protein